MKQEMEELNLRDAFRPMPQPCRNALMRAARSVKEEEKPVKHVTFRAVLIAACIIIATAAAAMAAGSIFGWTDFFLAFHHDTTVPRAAKEIMDSTEEQTFTLGPVTFKVQTLFADQHIAMATTQITMTDGSKALLCMDAAQGDAICANGTNSTALAEKLGLDPTMNWMEAARTLNCPLYCVRAVLDISADYAGGEGMEDALYDEKGCFVDFSLLTLNSSAVGSELPLRMFLRTAEIDLETGDEKNVLSNRVTISIRVAQPMAEQDYHWQGEYSVSGLKLDAVHSELTAAGLYLFTGFTAQDGMSPEDFYEVQLIPVWYDARGNDYPWGMNLSYEINTDEWPRVSMMGLISVDSIPDTLVLALEDDNAPDQNNVERITLTK